MWRRPLLSAASSALLLTALFCAAFLAVDAGLVAHHPKVAVLLLAAASAGAVIVSGGRRPIDLAASTLLGPAVAALYATLLDQWVVRPLDLPPRAVALALVVVGVAGFVSTATAKRRA